MLLQHQNELFRNFIDFKRGFDRVRYTGLWQVLRSFNINEGLVQASTILQLELGSDMSHTTTAPPKPSFKAHWRVGDAVVCRGNAGWTCPRVEMSAHARTVHKGLL